MQNKSQDSVLIPYDESKDPYSVASLSKKYEVKISDRVFFEDCLQGLSEINIKDIRAGGSGMYKIIYDEVFTPSVNEITKESRLSNEKMTGQIVNLVQDILKKLLIFLVL